MSVTIGSNIQSLRAQRSLFTATSRMDTSMERLSSGLRINRASDDAAGLSIASNLQTNSRLYSMASRNINDGISMLNIIDGSLGSQTAILSRLSELAEQSANGTYSSAQRASLQNEYLALQRESGRLADVTTFNGLKLLRADRSNGISSLLLQAGISGSSNSLIMMNGSDTSTLSGTFTAQTIVGQGLTTVDGVIDLGDFDTIAGKIPPTSGSVLQAIHYAQVQGSDGRTYDIAVAAVDYSDDGTFGSDYNNNGQVAVLFATYYKQSDGTWASAAVSGASAPGNTFTVTFDESSGHAISTSNGSGNQIAASLTMGSATGSLNLDLSSLKFFVSSDRATQTAIDFTGVESVDRARSSLTVLQNRLDELNSIRGTIGATQSRLDVANHLAQSSRENSSAAASRILDVDVAGEAGELTRQSILQNAAASILAQANQTPALALKLLSV